MPATATQEAVQWVARIFPRAPSKGYLARTYLLSGSGYPKFEEHRGWYGIDEAIISRLNRARNRSGDPDSKPVFQVCTLEQAEAVEEAEEEAAAVASNPIPIPRSRLSKLRPPSGGKVVPKQRATEPVEEKKPAFFETADPEDPEDREFMNDDEWPEDLAPPPEEPTKPTRRAAKKKVTKKTSRAKKKTPKKTPKK